MRIPVNPGPLPPRPSVDQVLIHIAYEWEKRSTCSRNQVGAVIAKDGRHIGSGYNGAPAGMPHCDHGIMRSAPNVTIHLEGQQPTPGWLEQGRVNRGCTTAIHAEANAIAYAARDGVAVQGGTIYVTLSPCLPCAQLIVASGLTRVVYDRPYRDRAGVSLLVDAGITVEKWLP